VLVLDGPPPPGLALTLPEGPLLESPRVVECKEVRPAAYIEQSGLMLSGVVPRSPAGAMLAPMLQRALRTEFRDKAGAAYAPFSTYERLDRESALVVAGSDVSPDLLPTLADRSLGLVRSLAGKGPAVDELTDEIESLVQGLSDPYRQAGLAFRAATFALEDREPQTLAEVVEELRGIQVDDVREAAVQFRRSMLAGVPGATTWKNHLPMLSQPDDPLPLDGRRHRHMDWPAEPARLVTGEDGVQVLSRSVRRSYRRTEIVGLYTYTDGGRDRHRRRLDAGRQPARVAEREPGGASA